MRTGKNDIRSLSEVYQSVDTTQPMKGWRKVVAFLGPAYMVSVGYMDPGNWATDLAGGSKFGYQGITDEQHDGITPPKSIGTIGCSERA
jgi:hypothetical protein